MKKTSVIKNIILVTRMLLCCTFLYAAIFKGMDFNNFIIEMKKSPILEPFNTAVVGTGVIFFEVVTALLLCFGKTQKAGLYLSFFIMLLFSGYLLILYTRYPNAPCSCGGILGRIPYPAHIAFNCTLTLLALVSIILYGKERFKTRDSSVTGR